jgi:ADP-ribose pyrophosphatase YjhB (NUDIX family)
MENAETLGQGAERETLEEANARVRMGNLYAIYSLPHINQVHVLFRAQLLDLDFKPGIESLEVRLFSEEEIPWEKLAFRVIREPLKRYFEERQQGEPGFHIGTIEEMRQDTRTSG